MVESEARALDLDARRLETAGDPIGYDRLVLAPGAELAPTCFPASPRRR